MRRLLDTLIYNLKPWTLLSYLGRLPGMTSLFQFLFYHLFSGPKSMKIHINSKCNYDCIYCYSDSHVKTLPTERWINLLNEISPYGIHTIEISGGEPFLDKDLFTIMNKCSDCGYQITVYTNGSLINEEWINKIKKMDTQTIISIKYSWFDEYEKLTKSPVNINRIEENIRMLVKANIPVVAFITVTKPSYNNIRRIINRSISLGAFPIVERYMPVKQDNINSTLKIKAGEWAKVLSMIKKVYSNYKSLIDGVNRIQGSVCSCYLTQFSVLQNGDVVPCQFLPSKTRIGNINQDSIQSIWKKMKNERIGWNKIPDACLGCKNKNLCRGGCKTYGYYINNRFDSKDPLCCSDNPTTYGHAGFTVIHSLGHTNNSGLNKI